MSIIDAIKTEVQGIENMLIEVRRDLHGHPELGFQEHRTAGIVADRLTEAGLAVQTGVGKTGVVARVDGDGDKCFGLRGDMDALPIEELADVPYKSATPGIMHACGHDVHTTALLGAGLVLQKLRDRLPGKVKLVFQPAEETVGGAMPMIEDGVLENPKVGAACAIHTDGDIPWHTIGLLYGENLAAADVLEIDIEGRGVHGAMPHEGRDPILAASNVVVALQQLVSRRMDPLDPAVLSICAIEGGTAFNIIPPKVSLKGTVRTLNEETRAKMEEWVLEVAAHAAEAYGCTAHVNYMRGCPPLVTDHDVTATVERAGTRALGEENVVIRKKPVMGAEDFAYFAERVPSAHIMLGIKPDADYPKISFHDPHYWADDRCLATGVTILCAAAFEWLG